MRQFILCAGCVLLAACASERVILLPSADGRASALVINPGAGEQRLAQPYAASARHLGSNGLYQASATEVQERFGPALAAQPPRPRSLLVYFQEGSDTLTADSLAVFDQLKAEIKARSAPEVMVIGHTDRIGSLQANDALSLKRAQTVRDVLLASGLDEKLIEVAGRGEREPLVPTEDEVAEARNRRVEISVR